MQVEPVSEVYIVNRGDGWTYRLNNFEILVGRLAFLLISLIVFHKGTIVHVSTCIAVMHDDCNEPGKVTQVNYVLSMSQAQHSTPLHVHLVKCNLIKLATTSGQAVHKLNGRAVHKLSGQAVHKLSDQWGSQAYGSSGPQAYRSSGS